jgi:hypothetical protein
MPMENENLLKSSFTFWIETLEQIVQHAGWNDENVETNFKEYFYVTWVKRQKDTEKKKNGRR